MWRDEVIEWVFSCWRDALQGRDPQTVWCWRKVFRRLGITRWHIVPSCELPEPFIRRHAIYLPRVMCNTERLVRFLAHEAAEAALVWDGVPPYLYVSDRDERHSIACEVEERVCAAYWESGC